MLEQHGSSRSTCSSRLARLARQSRTCRVESSQAKWSLCYTWFSSHIVKYVMPAYAENSIDAQNPNYSCPLKFLCLLHAKCRLSRRSLISVLELKSLVLVLSLSLESLLTSLVISFCKCQNPPIRDEPTKRRKDMSVCPFGFLSLRRSSTLTVCQHTRTSVATTAVFYSKKIYFIWVYIM